MVKEKIFREYDIRGIVPQELNEEIACALGKAFAVFVKRRNPNAKKVSVGRDARLTSESLAKALISGIRQQGLDVADIGMCPTPLQYFSIFHLGFDGGVMITGSHNPPEYNGFKISVGKETIHGEDIQALKKIILDDQTVALKATEVTEEGSLEIVNIINEYTKFMLKEFSYLSGHEYRKIKIVIDAGNGAAGPVVVPILKAMGCDVVPLYCDPDGRFPNHHPDPTVVENIQDLIAETKRTGADIGVGYDGDADRIGIVNRHGDIIWGDQLMIALSREILKEKPGCCVIADVKCSQLLFDDVKKHGGRIIMWKTGHSLIKQKMRDEGAHLAGEFSGHIFIGDRYFGFDDALYTTFRLVEIMKKTGKDICDLLADIPKLHHTPEIRLDCPDEKKTSVVSRMVEKFISYSVNGGAPHRIVEVDTTDGARIRFENGWGLIRSSNTQPVIVMRIEADSEKSLAEYRELLEAEFRAANF